MVNDMETFLWKATSWQVVVSLTELVFVAGGGAIFMVESRKFDQPQEPRKKKNGIWSRLNSVKKLESRNGPLGLDE